MRLDHLLSRVKPIKLEKKKFVVRLIVLYSFQCAEEYIEVQSRACPVGERARRRTSEQENVATAREQGDHCELRGLKQERSECFKQRGMGV